ncbi:ATP-binding protein [Parasphingorhabdus pacifica]
MVSIARTGVRGEPAGNLPADVTSFVGRRHEITRTKRLLAESRLVTLTGPGGVGKTRLALRVAQNLRRTFREKTWHVQLEELRDGSLVPEAVTEQLGINSPTSGDDLDAIVEHLKNRELLLVLDNCEHVVEEAALLVDTVLRACPGVRILATSRQSLGVAGESTLVVPPLPTPDPDHLPPPETYEQYSSVRLLVDRAKAAVPEFEVGPDDGAVLMRLCHHLDGNPMAIELAAVRLRSLSLRQLEDRLTERYELLTEGRRGAPARQQTLRALIDWSYDLCSDQDKVAWARVSVFSGSFDLAAAEHVASDGLSPVDVLGAMHSLVDQSILFREEESGEVRFRLMHALRDYGQVKLAASGEQERVLRRHCEWYAQEAERFAAEWIGPDQVWWVNKLRRDQDNLRQALHIAAASHETATMALRMASHLAQYWGIRGLKNEARYWINQALEITPPSAPERASALRNGAWFALLQGEPEVSEPMLDEAESILQRLDAPIESAFLTQTRGMAAIFGNDLESATRLLWRSLVEFREHGSRQGELIALLGLGLAMGITGRYQEGLELLGEGDRLGEQLGELYWRSYALWGLGFVYLMQDETERADVVVKDALRLQQQLDHQLAIAFSLETLSWIAYRQHRYDRAARLFGAANAVWSAIRATPQYYSTMREIHNADMAGTRAALGDHTFAQAFEAGDQLPLATALDLALEVKPSRNARAKASSPTTLTRREREIADLVAQGRTNKEIAESLVIAQRTVEGHVQHILTKLDFTSRTQIAGWVAARQTEAGQDPETL